jgi:receptor protein-tyrosine kinase
VAETQSSLPHYLHLLRRQLWLILLVVALAIGAAIGVTAIQQPMYSASTSMLVTAGSSPIDPRIAGDVQTFTQTMTEILEGYDVAKATIQKLDLNISTGELRNRLDVSSRPESAIIRVGYKAPDPSEAIQTVKTIRDVFLQKIDQLNSAGSKQSSTLESSPLVITALPLDAPHGGVKVSPRPARNLGAAGALGLVLGLILAFAREAVDDRIRSRRDAERWFGARVIGFLPRGLRGRPPFGLPGQPAPSRAEFVESLQLLRANLEFSEAGINGPTTVVTSALPEEGKSTVVANLGVALALAGHDVICVEADMRRPRLQHYLGLRSTGGLVDFLENRAELGDLLQTVTLYGAANGARPRTRMGRSRMTETGLRVDAPEEVIGEHRGRLRVLLAGAAPPNPADLFSGERVSRLIEELSTSAEFVLFDTPPLLLVGDAFPLVRVSDTVLVVAREGKTKRGSAEAVKATLEGLGVPKVSVVLTDSRGGGGGYGYGYGYGYGTSSGNGDWPPSSH